MTSPIVLPANHAVAAGLSRYHVFGELPFGAAVPTEAFLDIIHNLEFFDGLLEPSLTH
jgi:hypothetical protein